MQIPVSIYTFVSQEDISFFDNDQDLDLNLDLYKFIFPKDPGVDNMMRLDTRNFGRIASFEDIMDNYQKLELNKYFFSGYDLRTIPWRHN